MPGLGSERLGRGHRTCRKRDHDLTPTLRAVADPYRTSVGGNDFRDDRQTETGTAEVAFTGIVESHEPFEDSVTIWLRDARAVVGDDDPRGVSALHHLRVHGLCSKSDGIVDEVAHYMLELRAVTANPYRAQRGRDRLLGPTANAADFCVHHVVEIHLAEPQGVDRARRRERATASRRPVDACA